MKRVKDKDRRMNEIERKVGQVTDEEKSEMRSEEKRVNEEEQKVFLIK